MISRICAIVLVVLAVSPFTAPFSTFELNALLPHQAHSQGVPRTPVARDGVVTISTVAARRLEIVAHQMRARSVSPSHREAHSKFYESSTRMQLHTQRRSDRPPSATTSLRL
jgi:hypothetical protein